ncbi:MAG: hypothetical protein JNK60_06050 [Acidobacteria bacterium]|nr:hypothetical protein [Acidobacteriota bacterium]
MLTRRAAVRLAVLAALAPLPALSGMGGEGLVVYTLRDGEVLPEDGVDVPQPVGSLQKPFIARAWAEGHETGDPPRFRCEGKTCWLRAGHGELGLSAAMAESCNEYFVALAREVSTSGLASALRDAGFTFSQSVTAEDAVGLARAGTTVRITPRALLLAYAGLVRTEWPARDDVRRAVLEGLGRAASSGTASALARRGLLAKTGTVPVPGSRLATSGWALALDSAGRSGRLAFLPRGTGAEAAQQLARLDGHVDEGPAGVRIALFSALRPSRVAVLNASGHPVRVTHGAERSWLGPEATLTLTRDLRLEDGLYTLSLAPYGLVRHVRGALDVVVGRGGAPRITLTTTPRGAVEGILDGELPTGSPERRQELAAAVLRFLARGPRHNTADICDLTHCARFVGLGPAVVWESPVRARHDGLRPLPPALGDAAWEAALLRSRESGPSLFTGHCGGATLSEHAVWGRGERGATPCLRHASSPNPYSRTLPAVDLEALFRGPVTALVAFEDDGVRRVRVEVAGRPERTLLYDDLHSLLAARLGWDALPAPPDRFERTASGFRVLGRGRGHRVGLCLAT